MTMRTCSRSAACAEVSNVPTTTAQASVRVLMVRDMEIPLLSKRRHGEAAAIAMVALKFVSVSSQHLCLLASSRW
jgi:hypothetical protein